ncbi:hypothetical protein ACTXJF_05445 [Psychrobacter alimentarius]|uniref:hypothetical protein n=1 Tax=Psychrobacter alimentarius TaxID=261164 RepID=UPI003FCF546F
MQSLFDASSVSYKFSGVNSIDIIFLYFIYNFLDIGGFITLSIGLSSVIKQGCTGYYLDYERVRLEKYLVDKGDFIALYL